MEKIRAIVVAMIKALAVKTKAVWPYRWWILGVAFFLLPIICYFCIYHDGLSSDYNAWIAFGTLWGAVFGSLAFIIAIRTVYEGRKNAEREQIFNLLNLHQQKVEFRYGAVTSEIRYPRRCISRGYRVVRKRGRERRFCIPSGKRFIEGIPNDGERKTRTNIIPFYRLSPSVLAAS